MYIALYVLKGSFSSHLRSLVVILTDECLPQVPPLHKRRCIRGVKVGTAVYLGKWPFACLSSHTSGHRQRQARIERKAMKSPTVMSHPTLGAAPKRHCPIELLK